MAGRWAVGSIAGVDLEDAGGRPARVDVLDGESLNTIFSSSTVLALDFTVHTQVAANNLRGIHFGVHIAQLPIAAYQAIILAIETAMLDGEAFPVILADADGGDEADDINIDVVPDFQANGGKIAQRGALVNTYVKDVVFRFISES